MITREALEAFCRKGEVARSSCLRRGPKLVSDLLNVGACLQAIVWQRLSSPWESKSRTENPGHSSRPLRRYRRVSTRPTDVWSALWVRERCNYARGEGLSRGVHLARGRIEP